MDAATEKEVARLRVQHAALAYRAQTVLALCDFVNELVQLSGAQQRQLEALIKRPSENKPEDIDPAGGTVPSAAR